jgi:hypothetical protein
MDFRPGPVSEIEAKSVHEDQEKKYLRHGKTPRTPWDFLGDVAGSILGWVVLIVILAALAVGVRFLFSLFA